MADRLEARIRDHLSDHLDLLERGLTLVQREYVLKNPRGAGGKIDIVARDQFGHVVIIEIKRSDQSARQALHEMHKYTALFRGEQGLEDTKMRVFVVSTSWHELLVPLSVSAETFFCPVSGFRIDVKTDGIVLRAEPVSLLPKSQAVQFSRAHALFLFETVSEYDAARPLLLGAIKEVGVEDFVVFRLDYRGRDSNVLFPVCLYLVIASPLLNMSPAEAKALKKRIGWDDSLHEPDENFLVAVSGAMVDAVRDTEVGCPEKLSTLRSTWSVAVCTRAGRLEPSRSILTDDELLRLATATEGGGDVYLVTMTSPRFSTEWKRLALNMATVLQGMPQWTATIKLLLQEIEAENPTARVSVAAYNPTDLMISLYEIAASEDFSKCATLEIVVDDVENKCLRVIGSEVAWIGKRLSTTSPERMFDQVYGGFDHWCAMHHFRETVQKEHSALAAHKLSAPIVEIVFEQGSVASGPSLLVCEKRRLTRTPLTPAQYRPLTEFAQQNSAYLSALRAFMEKRIVGLMSDSIRNGADKQRG